MRISMHEDEALKVIGKEDPTFSSIAKIVKETGRARNEIVEIVEGLQKIGFLKLTSKNEVYLVKDGREYLGICTPNVSASAIEKREPVKQKLEQVKQEIKPASTLSEVKTSSIFNADKKRSKVFLEIAALADKLNKPVVAINDADLKVQALTRLAEFMADDIAELLIDVAKDINTLSKTNTPDEAA